MTGQGATTTPARATPVQRARAGLVRLVVIVARLLPQGVAEALAETIGEAYYRLDRRRAAQARRNLGRVVAWCAETGAGSARTRAAAGDPAVLERLVRAAFRSHAIIYLQLVRGPGPVRRALDEMLVETPEVMAAALAAGAPALFVGMHYGSVDLPAIFLARQYGRPTTGPAETLADPALQALVDELRRPMGIRMVPLSAARRELRAALDRGEVVGIVADRDIAGGGIDTRLFGMPAPFPVGPALVALDRPLPIFAASIRRLPGGRWAARMEPLPMPPASGSLRERTVAFLAAEAAVFERMISLAPEQWWAVFHPIWPDLEKTTESMAPGRRGSRR
ncbi:MAG: lysophospholipid acyltransferase family protein [Chloroflexi bacterium]|jgi:KDO2-lipid IV(A) lauroyltransferase|nr:lysophospholipid acyltransferase family protein [Chloroflexota bacterium]